jgi:hypothetical protein
MITSPQGVTITVPWHSATKGGFGGKSGLFQGPPPTGNDNHQGAGTSLAISDRPQTVLQSPIISVGNTQAKMTSISVVYDFDVFIAAATTDATAIETNSRNRPIRVFTQLRRASWKENFTGPVTNVRGSTVTSTAIWSPGPTAGITGSENFSAPLNEGDPVPVTEKPIYNELLNGRGSGWHEP